MTAAAADDAATLTALVALYGDLTSPHALHLLGWTDDRLDTALAAAGQQLEQTGLQLAVTDDDHLTLQLQPGALPDQLRARLAGSRLRRQPLSPRMAADLLKLTRDSLLEPFPGADHEDDLEPFVAHTLVETGLAVSGADPAGGSPQVVVHPDVLFALRLVGR